MYVIIYNINKYIGTGKFDVYYIFELLNYFYLMFRLNNFIIHFYRYLRSRPIKYFINGYIHFIILTLIIYALAPKSLYDLYKIIKYVMVIFFKTRKIIL